jgi:hypothetical protein
MGQVYRAGGSVREVWHVWVAAAGGTSGTGSSAIMWTSRATHAACAIVREGVGVDHASSSMCCILCCHLPSNSSDTSGPRVVPLNVRPLHRVTELCDTVLLTGFSSNRSASVTLDMKVVQVVLGFAKLGALIGGQRSTQQQLPAACSGCTQGRLPRAPAYIRLLEVLAVHGTLQCFISGLRAVFNSHSLLKARARQR